MAFQQTRKPECSKVSGVGGWGFRLAPVIVPMVNHETACLGALVVASQLVFLAGYVVALGCSLAGLKHSSPLATRATAKHADPSDPVLGHILSIACFQLEL